MLFDIVSGKGASTKIRFDIAGKDSSELAITAEKTKSKSEIIPEYAGPYEVTPSQEETVLDTAETRMTGNIVVKPIPSNYGRVSYNGAKLRIE